MRVMLSVGLHRSRFSYSCSDVEGECFGDRSCTLVASIVHRSAARPVTPLYLPLAAPSAASVVSSSSPQMVAIPLETPAPKEPMLEAWEAPGADGAPPDAASVKVDGAGP
jgi:hypothetical protein